MRIPWSLPPIIERELRLASRRNATYWSRVGAGAVSLVVFLTVMNAQLAAAPASNAGRTTFQVLAWMAGFMVVTSVVQTSATAFAREKREDTLGLLFLTPLKAVDLAAGKLVSASLGAFYRFVAVIPLLALPMLLGGVSVGNFLLLVLALANLIFYAGTLGIWVSAHSWDEKRALTTATLWLLGAGVLLPLLGVGLTRMMGLGAVGGYVAGLSPIFPLWQATLTGVGGSLETWSSLLVTHGLAWHFFCATCRALPVCWRNRPVEQEPVLREMRLRREEALVRQLETVPRPGQLASAGAAGRARRMVRRQFTVLHRQELLQRNPILWLTQRWRAPTSMAWVVGSISLVAFVSSALGMGWGPWQPPFVLFVCFCINAGFKVHVVTQASLAFARDRGEDTLELLLSTPVTPRQLVQGHLQAICAPLQVWIRRVIWIESGWMTLAVLIGLVGKGDGGVWVPASLFVVMICCFIPDLHAVAWRALWEGVIAKNARTASSNAQVAVLYLPWILAIGGMMIGWWVMEAPGLGFFGALFALSLFMDRWHIRRARSRLYANLRLWALRRAAGEFEHYDDWRRLGRQLGRWWLGYNPHQRKKTPSA